MSRSALRGSHYVDYHVTLTSAVRRNIPALNICIEGSKIARQYIHRIPLNMTKRNAVSIRIMMRDRRQCRPKTESISKNPYCTFQEKTDSRKQDPRYIECDDATGCERSDWVLGLINSLFSLVSLIDSRVIFHR